MQMFTLDPDLDLDRSDYFGWIRNCECMCGLHYGVYCNVKFDYLDTLEGRSSIFRGSASFSKLFV